MEAFMPKKSRYKRGYCANCGHYTGRRASKGWEPFCTQRCAASWALGYLNASEVDYNEDTQEYEIA